MGIATSRSSLIPRGVLQGSSSSNVRKRRFLVQCIPSLQGRAYSCLRSRNFGQSIPPFLQCHNVCQCTQVYREPRWARCNPHDTICTMQSARCNPHDTIYTMQSVQCTRCNPYDTIRMMHMMQSAQYNPKANLRICTTATTATMVTMGWLR